MTQTTITPDLVRAALQYIPASLPRDDWARVAMGIKAEYPDQVGRDLFTEWSATADGYSASDTASTWRSVKAGGAVKIGTLLRMAKENGFILSRVNQAAMPPSAAQLAQQARDRAAKQDAEKASIEAAQTAAAIEAARLWDAASDTGHSAYLDRKGVLPHGVRFTADGWLLVPVRDGAGKLWNVQRIAPSKPSNGGPDKLFLKGGRVSGLWHMLGAVVDAVGAASASPPVVLVGEGLATCASLHQATGYPVAVAFDAGKVYNVALALRALYPAALLVLCGDDDLQTFAAKGHNPGRDKATAAARAVKGVAVFPAPLPDGGSDFNDLHQHLGGQAGLDAVALIVATGVDAHQAQQAQPAAPSAAQAPKTSKGRSPAPNMPADPQSDKPTDPFQVLPDGVWHFPPDSDNRKPCRVCGPLRVVAAVCDAHDNQAALLLDFDTDRIKGRTWMMPLHMLAGDGAAYRNPLLSQGFMTPTDTRRRALLTEYLQSRRPAELVRHVPKVGWHGRCYVLPNETLGTPAAGERLMFHSEAGAQAKFSQRGTLDAWRDNIAALAVGNSRMAFCIATAFAGPLLAWASGVTGGGFHATGTTSAGKSTIFLAAASVWGRGTENDADSYMQKWRTTVAGMEYQAEHHSDGTLIYDELGVGDANALGGNIYMLADGVGKSRSKAAGGLRPTPTWRTLFLSSGELTPAQMMEATGQKMRGGQEVRLIPIPFEVKPGSTLETFHAFEDGHTFSNRVKDAAARTYGTAGRAWLEHLVGRTDGLAGRMRERMDTVEAAMVPAGAAGQVRRGGRRFALVAVAGEMATEAGLTGWPAGEATRAAKACFDAWLASRGGAGSSELAAMLRQVKGMIESSGESGFTWMNRATDDHASKTVKRLGFKRFRTKEGKAINSNKDHQDAFGIKAASDGDWSIPESFRDEVSTEYFVLGEAFRTEVCKGYDHKTMLAALLEAGCLAPDKGEPYGCKPRIAGLGTPRGYMILDKILSLDI